MHFFTRKKALLIVLMCCAVHCFAQPPPGLPQGLSISGYADVYAAYNNDSLPAGTFQKFPTYAPRSNSIGLNIFQLSAAYKNENEKVRAIATLHYGDIPASSWSATFNMLQEANAGIRLSQKLWLDAGFFRSHIGTEGLFPKENITSSIAIVTLYEPYYEAGIKLTYQLTPKLEGRLYLLNGYNLFEDNNRRKSLGMLFTYSFSDASNLVYSNYLGDDFPDTVHTPHTRFYNNIYYNYNGGSDHKLRLTVGIDFAWQQHSDLQTGGSGTGFMSGWLLAARYIVSGKVALYAREEFFYDSDAFLAGTYKDKAGKDMPLECVAGTFGIEYKPLNNAYIRLEGRALSVNNDVAPFYYNGAYHDQRYEAILSLGVWFDNPDK